MNFIAVKWLCIQNKLDDKTLVFKQFALNKMLFDLTRSKIFKVYGECRKWHS